MGRVINVLLVLLSDSRAFAEDGIDGRLHRTSRSAGGFFVAAEESDRRGPEGTTIFLAQETGSGRRVLLRLGARERVDGSDGIVANDNYVVAWFTTSTAEVQFASIVSRKTEINKNSVVMIAPGVSSFRSPGRVCGLGRGIFGMVNSPMHGLNNCLFRAQGDQVVVKEIDPQLELDGVESEMLRFKNKETGEVSLVRPKNLHPGDKYWSIIK